MGLLLNGLFNNFFPVQHEQEDKYERELSSFQIFFLIEGIQNLLKPLIKKMSDMEHPGTQCVYVTNFIFICQAET